MPHHNPHEIRNLVLALATHRAEPRLPYRDRMAPLVARLEKLLDSLPHEVIAAGLSVPDLAAKLTGRHAKHPAQRDVAAALRQLGYVARRQWSTRATAGCPSRWFLDQKGARRGS